MAFKKDFDFSITCMHAYKGSKPREKITELNKYFNTDIDLEVISGDLNTAFEKYISTNKVDIIIMGTKGS